MRPIRWFNKGWESGVKPGIFRFSRSLAGRIACFGYWLRKKGRKELPQIEWMTDEEVARLTQQIKPKPRGIFTNGHK